jgi:undecaprenyl pyrophosphate phosphatase UppP
MEELENLKDEVERLEPVDRRWLVIVATIPIAAVLFAILVGSVVGDVLAFLIALAAGWVVHTQWLVIARYRRRQPRSRAGGTKPRSSRRGRSSKGQAN